VPRKGGPGISQSDLFIINKVSYRVNMVGANPQTDLAPHVGASLDVMKRDAAIMRESGPTLFTSVRNNDGVKEVIGAILGAWKASGAVGKGKPKVKA
jgi:urease accessory protein